MKISAALLAAGSSSRMGRNKLTMALGGMSVLERSLRAIMDAGIGDVVIVVSDCTIDEGERLADIYGCRVVRGGKTRGESVLNALEAMECDIVVIHDGARCLVSRDIILDSVTSAAKYGSGVSAVPARDTLMGSGGQIIDRSTVSQMQTPQSFDYEKILAAYRMARDEGFEATDDCSVYQRMWGEARLSKGSLTNQKLTYSEDVPFFATMAGDIRIGYGEDTHRLAAGRKLVLGGVDIPFELGLLGHSDADVITHAAIDAMLGAAALGDIGNMFPDSCEEYRGISSMKLLKRAAEEVRKAGYALCSLDVTCVAQKPRLAPHIPSMRKQIAEAICCPVNNISVKATTPEHTGPEGRLESITARAVCMLRS